MMSAIRRRLSTSLPEKAKSVLKRIAPALEQGELPVGGEGPRGYVGGLWYEMGELQFKFLIDHGLRPEHTLLDIACGALRLGNRVVPYLDRGNYLGIDIKEALIEHGKEAELGPTLCALKQPEFVVSDNFEFWKFTKRPDMAIAQSLFSHLIESDIGMCLENLALHRRDDTVFYATFNEAPEASENPAKSDPHGYFQYTRVEMERLGQRTGWKMTYIGDWHHPRDQKMIKYAVA